MRKIRRLLGTIAVVAATTIGMTIGTATPASAWGGEYFGCRIAPGYEFGWYPGCTNSSGAAEFNVGFAVFGTDSSYTFSWSITGPYRYVITGCTSTSYDCAVAVGRGSKEIYATVTFSQGGQSATASAVAIIEPWCGAQPC